jgi:SAM-dependent methyltransferase
MDREPSFSSGTDSVTDSEPEGEVEQVVVSRPFTYADPEFWEQRYSKDLAPFEWYMSWARLKPLIGSILSESSCCLHVGCGTSALGSDILETGIKTVVNIDICQALITHMAKRYSHEKRLKWRAYDIRRGTEFRPKSFNVVLDKATMDAMMCSDIAASLVSDMFTEVARLLKPGGHYIVVSSGPEPLRKMFFLPTQYGWTLHETLTIDKLPVPGTYYYVYITEMNGG